MRIIRIKENVIALIMMLLVSGIVLAQTHTGNQPKSKTSTSVREVNQIAQPDANRVIAIVGATLIDGRGGVPVKDSVVVARGERIIFAGQRAGFRLPANTDIFDAKGMTLLPGLIDAHFHIDGDDQLPGIFLENGVTSLRDPGQWIEAYDEARKAGGPPVPRLFLTGPHIDSPPAAYPNDSFVVRDEEEARRAVNRFVDQGASGIKIYFRLPLGLIKAVSQTAHERGVPVTAHLEIVDADEAARAGTDGIEHITSFGTSLLPAREAEKYRQSILKDNNARREGRYAVWNNLNLNSPKARSVMDLLSERGTFVCPTLAIFERRTGDKDTNETHVAGFRNMLTLVGKMQKGGVRLVIGSHSAVPHAERGWAYQRELELMVEAGLTPMQAIVAGTYENARFFRSESRIGSIEKGKLADLLLIEGDPLKDIKAMRNVRRVMLGGVWIRRQNADLGGAK
jgi:imidazolonepropionase-like amidohydrolase